VRRAIIETQPMTRLAQRLATNSCVSGSADLGGTTWTTGFWKSTNGAAERVLRAVAIGRKNYLFMGADSGSQRAASL
jgi:hypothetical protein